ncbi:MAG: (2Fe-2S)-binding protein [Defluviicoccus sp.]|nr:(2Fe-2S)-binding protein [Defluviicoccus sp.]
MGEKYADPGGVASSTMYVCICNRYREGEIRDLAAGGARSAEEAYSALGGEPRCGRCLSFAQQLMDEVSAQAARR